MSKTRRDQPGGSDVQQETEKRILAHHLEVKIVPPDTEECQRAFADCVRGKLNLDSITPVYREIAPGVWLCHFLHGPERDRWVTTYEDGPGMLKFPPQRATAFVFDQPRKILYFTSGRRDAANLLLPALPGVILPAGAEVPKPYHLNLKQMDSFCAFYRHPFFTDAPWNYFKLKETVYQKPGYKLSIRRIKEDDLLEDPAFFERHRDERLNQATFSVYIGEKPQRKHRLEIRDKSNVIYSKIRPFALPAIGAILDYMDEPVDDTPAGDPGP